MSRYFARIVRAMVVSILGFGGGVGLLVMIVCLVMKGDQHAFQYGINAGLIIGGIFAIFLVCVMLPLDLTSRLFASKGGYKEIWELEQTREVTMPGPLREVTAVCREALLTVPYMQSVFDDTEKPGLKANIGQSWRSAGEEMDIEFRERGDGSWLAHCTSRCRSNTVLFDYAKNFDNVEYWQKAVLEKLNSGKKAS